MFSNSVLNQSIYIIALIFFSTKLQILCSIVMKSPLYTSSSNILPWVVGRWISVWSVLVVVSNLTEALAPSAKMSLIVRNKAELKFYQLSILNFSWLSSCIERAMLNFIIKVALSAAYVAAG